MVGRLESPYVDITAETDGGKNPAPLVGVGRAFCDIRGVADPRGKVQSESDDTFTGRMYSGRNDRVSVLVPTARTEIGARLPALGH